MLEILTIILLIYITLILNLKLNNKIEKFKQTIFISSPNDYLKSFLILIGFIIGFIFLFRILRLFFSKTSYIYFGEYQWVLGFVTNIKILIVILFLILILLFFFKKLVTIYIKNIYRYGIKKKYTYFVVIPRVLNYLAIFVQFLTNDSYIYIGWLPWYALYYFVINCLIFYGDFKSNFDAGVCIYYKGIEISEYGFYKLKQYQIYLIFKDNKYIFVDDIDILKNKKIILIKNVLYFDSNDYDIKNA